MTTTEVIPEIKMTNIFKQIEDPNILASEITNFCLIPRHYQDGFDWYVEAYSTADLIDFILEKELTSIKGFIQATKTWRNYREDRQSEFGGES